MLALSRLLILGAVAGTVVHGSLRLYLRAAARERLEAAWEARGRPGRHDRFVALGLSRHAARIRWPLVALCYGLPLASVSLIVYFSGSG